MIQRTASDRHDAFLEQLKKPHGIAYTFAVLAWTTDDVHASLVAVFAALAVAARALDFNRFVRRPQVAAFLRARST